MDTDSANTSRNSRDVIAALLEIAQKRPGTNVSKAILAYVEAPGPTTLITVLEEVSKNTDYSTDLNLSQSFYIDEFLNQINKMPRRLLFSAASSVLDYCSKIYSDRVEYMFQVVQQQIASLIISEPKADETPQATAGNNETRKRRTKKLVQNETDSSFFKMEPRKFKTMSDEKRFSRVGFEANKNLSRTIEHMYLDHTPSHLWKYAPIVDPDNPHDKDEKKNYKLFTYLPEPRYNTLLTDIQFERLNLIKEYVNANHDLSDVRHENMSNREYLDEYIALENQMLASRFGDVNVYRHPPYNQCDEQDNSISLEQKRSSEFIENSPKRIRLSETHDTNMTTDDSGAPQTDLEDTSNVLTLTDASDAQLNESQLPDSAFSSTLIMNDSSCFNSTPMDLEQTKSEMESGRTEKLEQEQTQPEVESDNTTHLEQEQTQPGMDSQQTTQLEQEQTQPEVESQQATQLEQDQTQPGVEAEHTTQLKLTVAHADDSIDAGIGMENVTVPLVTDHSEDQDHQRMLSLSPKVLVRDILPGVPDKENLSVHVDSEMRALGGVNEEPEEILKATYKVHYPITCNLLNIPNKKLRSERLFALTSDFKLFMDQRVPPKRTAVPKPPRVVNALPPPREPAPELEFDSHFNFLGFRRPTHDSGIDYEETSAELIDVCHDEKPTGIAASPQPVRDVEVQTENDVSLLEIPMDTMETTTQINETTANAALDEVTTSSNIPMDTMDDMDIVTTAPNAQSESTGIDALPEIPQDTKDITATQHDSGFEVTPNIPIDTLDDVDIDTTAPNAHRESTDIDALPEVSQDTRVITATQHDSGFEVTPASYKIKAVTDTDNDWDADDNMASCTSIDEETDARINEWHRRIAPVLELAHERQNFSIEGLNKEVIQNCVQHYGEATLGDVMNGKDPTKISCYLLSSLLLVNHGNVALEIPKGDGPIDIDQFKMKLLSTELKQVNPEDEIGNVNNASSQPNTPATRTPQPTGHTATALRRKSTEQHHDEVTKVKVVRLIKPVPKAHACPDDADSGISSLAASMSSAFSNDT